jgi:hypothetical protein
LLRIVGIDRHPLGTKRLVQNHNVRIANATPGVIVPATVMDLM